MQKEAYPVFVYGTLRWGCRNHHYLAQARYLGHALTCERYALFLGQYPYVQRLPQDAGLPLARIVGEVYALDRKTFAAVDALEDHPHDYCRELAAVELGDGRVLQAWIYFHPCPEGVWTPSGDALAGPRGQ